HRQRGKGRGQRAIVDGVVDLIPHCSVPRPALACSDFFSCWRMMFVRLSRPFTCCAIITICRASPLHTLPEIQHHARHARPNVLGAEAELVGLCSMPVLSANTSPYTRRRRFSL